MLGWIRSHTPGDWTKEWPREFPAVRPVLHLEGTKGTRPALVSLVTSVSVSVRRGPIPWFVTMVCCLSLSQSRDKYSGYEEAQWGPIVSCDKSESWSSSKGTQLRGIGLSEQKVVLYKKSNLRSAFWYYRVYIHYRGRFKAPLKPWAVLGILIQLS